jgi:hypothetical protein
LTESLKVNGLKGSISSKGSICSDYQPIELIKHLEPFEQKNINNITPLPSPFGGIEGGHKSQTIVFPTHHSKKVSPLPADFF